MSDVGFRISDFGWGEGGPLWTKGWPGVMLERNGNLWLRLLMNARTLSLALNCPFVKSDNLQGTEEIRPGSDTMGER